MRCEALPCSRKVWTAGVWPHVILKYHRDSAGNETYDSVKFDTKVSKFIGASDARIVVLELSEVHAIEAGGLGMLVFLRRWALDHNIRFLLFNPSKSVRDGLKRARSISEFYIPTMDEMMALLVYANSRYALAA